MGTITMSETVNEVKEEGMGKGKAGGAGLCSDSDGGKSKRRRTRKQRRAGTYYTWICNSSTVYPPSLPPRVF
jgi:hypothetical protein